MSRARGSQPGGKKKKRIVFTPSEDQLLLNLVSINGTSNWETIAEMIPGRTARQCRERWKSFLAPGITNGPWTPEEDEKLIYLQSKCGSKWVTIAKFFKGRSDINVKNRWYTHILKQKHVNEQSEQPQSDSLPIFYSVERSNNLLWGNIEDVMSAELYELLDNCVDM